MLCPPGLKIVTKPPPGRKFDKHNPVKLPLVVLSLHRPLVVSSCRMVAALTLVVPPSRPRIVPHSRPSNVPPHRRHCMLSSPSRPPQPSCRQCRAVTLPPSCRRRPLSRCRHRRSCCAAAAALLPPPRRRQAAADLALSRCRRRRRAAIRWLVVVLLSAVRFRHHMPSCDHHCLPPPPPPPPPLPPGRRAAAIVGVLLHVYTFVCIWAKTGEYLAGFLAFVDL